MESYKISEDRAFAVLVRASQTSNIKLRDVAQDLLNTDTLQGAAPPVSREQRTSRTS